MDLKLPPKGTKRFAVLTTIYKLGPSTVIEILERNSSMGYTSLRDAILGCEEMGYVEHENDKFDLTQSVRRYFDGCEKQAPKEVYVGQIAAPRDESLYQKAWSGKFSISSQARRSDAEPAREAHFLTSGTSPKPLIVGAA